MNRPPSVDPAYANASNELWPDATTDARGNGTSTSTAPWAFPADRRAGSVIISEKATTGPARRELPGCGRAA